MSIKVDLLYAELFKGNKRYNIFIYLLLFPIFLFPNIKVEKEHVLILHSYHQGLQWTDNINKGIFSEFSKHSIPDYELSIEYMDGKRHYSDEYFEQFSKTLEHKLKGVNLKVVITSDDIAFKYAIENQNTILKNTTIVFCGVNHLEYYEEKLLQGKNNYTGVTEGFDLKRNIDMAFKNHPNANQLLIINDSTPTGIANKKAFDKIRNNLDNDKTYTFIKPFNLSQAKEELKKYSSETIILLMSYNKDASGKYYSYQESAKIIRQATNLPIYVVWDFYLPYKVIGGFVTSGVSQGKTAAKLTKQIINGKTVKEVPIIRKSPNEFIFNYAELKKHEIKISKLPRNSKIIGQPKTLIIKYKKELLAVFSFFIVLILTIIRLLIITRKKTKAEQNVFLSNNKLSTIIETANQGFIEFDNKGVITKVNYEACRILELDRYAIVNKSIDVLLKLNKYGFNNSLITQCYNGDSVTFELKIANKKLKTKYLVVNGTPIFSIDHTKIIGAFVLISDISSLKLHEKELLKSKEKAEKSDKLKSAFLANMSHEIRTPMNAIIGFSELLEYQNVNNEQRNLYVKTIQKSGKQLLALINDILDISKIEAGELTISKTNIKVENLLQNLFTTFKEIKNELNKSEVKLKLGNIENGLSIYTDEIRLNQIFSNLINNSLKFTSKGFIEFGISKNDSNSIIFYVKDTGIGISDKEQEAIFKRFKKLESTESVLYRGAGLGLAISKNLTELLGGKIWVESKLNQGSIFYFSIAKQIHSSKKVLHQNISQN